MRHKPTVVNSQELKILEPHQLRIIHERDELGEKLNKLEAFFETGNYKSLVPDEKERLVRQFSHMRDYFEVLNERIDAWWLTTEL